MVHLRQGHVQELAQRQGRRGAGRPALGGPNDMQNDAGEGGIALVMMRLPILRQHVNFHVARARFLLSELQDGAAKNPGPAC